MLQNAFKIEFFLMTAQQRNQLVVEMGRHYFQLDRKSYVTKNAGCLDAGHHLTKIPTLLGCSARTPKNAIAS